MAENIVDGTRDFLHQQVPWRRGVAWWVVLLQGILALVLGLYILFRQGVAGIQAVQFLGIYLLVISVIGAIRGVMGRVAPRAMPYHMLASGVGLATGAIISLDIWQDFMTPAAALVIVSTGLLLYGIAGLLEWFLGGGKHRTWLALGIAIVSVLLGLAVLWSRLALAGQALLWTGIVATLAGVGLIAYALILYGRQKQGGAGQQATADLADDLQQSGKAAVDDVADPMQDLGQEARAMADRATDTVQNVPSDTN